MPEIMLAGWGLLLLIIGGLTRGPVASKTCGVLSVIGSVCAMYFTVNLWGGNQEVFNQLYTIDNFGNIFKGLFIAILILVSVSPCAMLTGNIGSGEYIRVLMFGVLGRWS
jgi:NADH:ubiquinone oxidoreductase subunit 2 (subunit N)